MTKRSGFTLIELLVVVVIIGILAAIGVGGYAAAMEKARNSGVISNTRTVFTGIEQWKADHTGLPVDLCGTTHEQFVCADNAAGTGDFPTKYLPGGRMPVAPWSKNCQITVTAPFKNGGANSVTAAVSATDSADTQIEVTKEGWIVDGGPQAGLAPVLGSAPSQRSHFGYVYYCGDTSSNRFAVVGIGKYQKESRAIALKTNYQ